MSWTKRQLVEQAFAEIGLAGYIFDLSAEQLQTALRQLDSMMATYSAKGVFQSYPIASSPATSDLDQDSNVPITEVEAVYLNLALRIGPSFGKTVPVETRINAKIALENVMSLAAFPPQQQLPGTIPAGAGNKTWRDYGDPFIRPPNENPLQNGSNGNLEFLGD
jgi:hypothetical protein